MVAVQGCSSDSQMMRCNVAFNITKRKARLWPLSCLIVSQVHSPTTIYSLPKSLLQFTLPLQRFLHSVEGAQGGDAAGRYYMLWMI